MDLRHGWYCVTSYPKREPLAAHHLLEKGFEILYPKLRIFKKREPLLVPLFPNYLFVRISDDPPWYEVLYTRGIIGYVSIASGGAPTRVQERVIDSLRSRLDAQGILDSGGILQRRDLKAGDRVRVSEGPLRGWEGICLLPAKQRVAVLFETLRGSRTVYLDRNLIEIFPEEDLDLKRTA